jgi:hypothetical protein
MHTRHKKADLKTRIARSNGQWFKFAKIGAGSSDEKKGFFHVFLFLPRPGDPKALKKGWQLQICPHITVLFTASETEMNSLKTVICMKWGTLYPASYVNVLYHAVRRHISGDLRFVCLTDDAQGLDPAIDHFPIPDMGLSEFDWKKGGWPKLSVFKKTLYDLSGRCLFLDLDSLITGPLDALFDHPGDVVTIDTSPNWARLGGHDAPMAGTGVFTFTIGQFPEIFDRFMADHSGMVAKYRIEQIYLQGELPPGALRFWPLDWVLSFKYHLRRPPLLGLVQRPKPPLPDTRVVAFHGEPRPIDLVRPGIWGIAPHLGQGRVPWAVNYWRENGGNPERD